AIARREQPHVKISDQTRLARNQLAFRGTFPSAPVHIADPARGARIASVPEAQLEDLGSGLTPVTEGWFVATCATPSGGSRRRGARGAHSRASTATRRSSSP